MAFPHWGRGRGGDDLAILRAEENSLADSSLPGGREGKT